MRAKKAARHLPKPKPGVRSDDALNQLVALYKAGQLEKAEQLGRQLSTQPRTAIPALKVLGALLQQQGRLDEALALKLQAVQLAPNDPSVQYNLGTTLQALDRLDEAVVAYQAATRLKPDFVDAHNNLGVALNALGRRTEAEAAYREAIRLAPDHDKAHSNLGVLLQTAGRLQEAAVSYQTALKLNEVQPEALNNLGVVFKELGQNEQAIACYQAAWRQKPDYAAAYSNCGVALKALGRMQDAERCYRKAISLDNGYAEAFSNLGVLLKDVGRLAESESAYKQAISLKPDYAEAYNNLGVTVKELGRLGEAEAAYREAIRLNPSYPEACSNLGVLFKDLGLFDQAMQCYQAALRIKSDYIDARSNLLFAGNYMASVTPDEVLQEAKQFGALVSARAQPKFSAWQGVTEPEVLRIGLVSGDLRQHPVGYFTEALLAHLVGQRCEVWAFPTTPKADDVTQRIQALCQGWVPIYGKTDAAAAALIHAQGVHVLVDLSGHTAHNRLGVFAYKPAPVQVSWLGYFATTGLPEMDYFLGDPTMAPANEGGHFTERLWQLKETWLCLTPPSHAPDQAPSPVLQNGYVTFGCFGNLAKMNNAVVALWASILQACPSSRLFLKAKQLTDAAVVASIQKRFAAHGVAPARLILEGLSSRQAYLEAYHRIDMVLDTFPYPGGTTSAEAYWMGIPVLTMKGQRFLSHLGESIAHNVHNPVWIAKDGSDYRAKAIRFATDTAALAERGRFAREVLTQSPLFDAPRFAASFAEAMWGMYLAGGKPQPGI